jgi:hypothetical protein
MSWTPPRILQWRRKIIHGRFTVRCLSSTKCFPLRHWCTISVLVLHQTTPILSLLIPCALANHLLRCKQIAGFRSDRDRSSSIAAWFRRPQPATMSGTPDDLPIFIRWGGWRALTNACFGDPNLSWALSAFGGIDVNSCSVAPRIALNPVFAGG